MNSMYDVRNLLKLYGVFVYTGNQVGDLELMSDEIKQLYETQMIRSEEYQISLILIRRELAYLRNKKRL